MGFRLEVVKSAAAACQHTSQLYIKLNVLVNKTGIIQLLEMDKLSLKTKTLNPFLTPG